MKKYNCPLPTPDLRILKNRMRSNLHAVNRTKTNNAFQWLQHIKHTVTKESVNQVFLAITNRNRLFLFHCRLWQANRNMVKWLSTVVLALQAFTTLLRFPQLADYTSNVLFQTSSQA